MAVATRRGAVDRTAVLDLKARVFKVEVPFDAPPRYVVQPAPVPQLEQLRRPLCVQRLPPETLACQRAFLIAIILVVGASDEAGNETGGDDEARRGCASV
jgi:hypothetical protein